MLLGCTVSSQDNLGIGGVNREYFGVQGHVLVSLDMSDSLL